MMWKALEGPLLLSLLLEMPHSTIHKGYCLTKKNIFFWITFLGCLAGLATLAFWPGIAFEERDLIIPIHYDRLPKNAIITGPLLKNVEVKVRGKEGKLKSFLQKEHAYSIDLTNATAGLVTLPINIDHLQRPKGISLIQITPTSVTLRIEAKIAKVVPVTAVLVGKLAAGYKVAQTITDPPEITLSGAKKIISELDRLNTKPIHIDGISDSFKKEIAFDLPEGVEILSPKKLATVDVTIEEQVAVKKYSGIFVEGRHTEYPYEIKPATIDITVKGPELALEHLSAENAIQAYLDLTNLTPGVHPRSAKINLPIGITLVDADPGVFTVTINP